MPGYFISSLYSVPRVAFGVAMLTLLRVPFFVEAMRPWRTPGRSLRPQNKSDEMTGM